MLSKEGSALKQTLVDFEQRFLITNKNPENRGLVIAIVVLANAHEYTC